MTAKACLSGAVLSSLLFEQANCASDQEGFLLGKVGSHVKDTISDSQINNVKVETNIFVYQFCTFVKPDSFHNKQCQISIDKMQAAVPSGYQLVGWYHTRRNASPRMSLREKNIHRNLLALQPTGNEDNFLFLMFNMYHSDNLSTHTVNYNFYQFNSNYNRYVRVPAVVCNLGDTTHTEYRNNETSTVNTETGVFASIVARHEHHMLSKDGVPVEVSKVKELAGSLQRELKSLTAKLYGSEQSRSKLEDEIKSLQNKLAEKKKVDKPTPVPQNGSAENTSDSINDDKSAEVATHSTDRGKPSYEESVAIAKQKRESRRKDAVKNNLGLRNKNFAKSKADGNFHHSRKLSTEDRYESDLITLNGEDEKSSDQEQAEVVRAENIADHVKINPDVTPVNMEFSFTSSSQESEVVIPELDTSTEEESKSDKIQKGNENVDHFSFVSSILAEAKTKPNSKTKAKTQSSTETSQQQNKSKKNVVDLDNVRQTRGALKKNQNAMSSESETRITEKSDSGSSTKSGKDDSVSSVRLGKDDPLLLKDCRVEANSVTADNVINTETNGAGRENESNDIHISSSPVF